MTGMTGNQHLEMTSKNMETPSSIYVSSELTKISSFSSVRYARLILDDPVTLTIATAKSKNYKNPNYSISASITRKKGTCTFQRRNRRGRSKLSLTMSGYRIMLATNDIKHVNTLGTENTMPHHVL